MNTARTQRTISCPLCESLEPRELLNGLEAYGLVDFVADHGSQFSSEIGYMTVDGTGACTGEITAVANSPASGSAVPPPGPFSGSSVIGPDRSYTNGATHGFVSLDNSLMAQAVAAQTADEETGIGLMVHTGLGLDELALDGRYNFVTWSTDFGSRFTSGIGYLDFDGTGGCTGEMTQVAQGQPTGGAFDAGPISSGYTVADNGLLSMGGLSNGYVSADGSLFAWAPVPGDIAHEESGVGIAVRQGASYGNDMLRGKYYVIHYGSDHAGTPDHVFTSGIGYAYFDGDGAAAYVSAFQAQGQSGDSSWGAVWQWAGDSYSVDAAGTFTMGQDGPAGFVSADGSIVILATAQTNEWEETGVNILVKAPEALAGDWSLVSIFSRGSISIDEWGNVTGGSVIDIASGATSDVTGGTCFTGPDGQVTMTLTVNVDGGGEVEYDLTGAVNASRDVVTISPSARPMDPQDSGDLILLVRHTGTFTNADLSGTWGFAVQGETTGVLSFDGQGHVASGWWKSGEGDHGNVTGGTYSVAPDGGATVTLLVSTPEGPQSMDFTGALNDHKNVLVVNEVSPQDPDDPGLVVMTRVSSGLGAADLWGQWYLAADQTYGEFVFDGHGHLTGNYTNDEGNTYAVNGTYSVSSSGRANITMLSNEPDAPSRITLTGTLGTSRDVLAMTETNSGEDDDADMVVLVNGCGMDLVGQFGEITLAQVFVPGDRGKAPVIVSNVGQVRAVGRIAVRVYASEDGLWDGEDVLLGGAVNQAVNLGASQSKTLAVNLRVPNDCPAGQYYLLAVVDATNVIAEGDEANNVAITDGFGRNVWQFGQVPGHKACALTVLDDQGQAVTFKLAGAGYGTVEGGPAFTGVILTGVTETSSLTISSRGPNAVVDIEADGTMKAIAAKRTNLAGDVHIDGGLSRLDLANVADGHEIVVGPSLNPAAAAFTFTAARVANTDLHSAIPVKSITVTEWIDDDGTDDVIEAAWLGALTTKGDKKAVPAIPGDFQAHLNLSGQGAATTTLGTVKIAGDLSEAIWDVIGATAKLTVVGTAGDSTVRSTGPMGGITLGAAVRSNFLAGLIDTVQRHPTSTGDFLSVPVGDIAPAITFVKITGLKVPLGQPIPTALEDACFSAHTIGAVSLLNADFDNAGEGFGLYALWNGGGSEIKSVKYVDQADSGNNWNWPGVGALPGDFEIEVLQ